MANRPYFNFDYSIERQPDGTVLVRAPNAGDRSAIELLRGDDAVAKSLKVGSPVVVEVAQGQRIPGKISKIEPEQVDGKTVDLLTITLSRATSG